MEPIKLYNTELAGQKVKVGFDKLDTEVFVEEDHSFVLEGKDADLLANHLRSTCPFIMNEEEFGNYSKAGSTSLKDETGMHFNQAYKAVLPEPGLKPKSKANQNLDAGKLKAENEALKTEMAELVRRNGELILAAEESDATVLQSKITSLENEKKELGANITRLEGDLRTAQDAISQNEKNFENLKGMSDLAESEVKRLEGVVKDLEKGADAKLQAELKAAQEMLEKVKACNNIKEVKALFEVAKG